MSDMGQFRQEKIKHFVKNVRLWETGSYVTCQNITSFIQDERLSIYICTNKFYTIKCPNIFVEEKLTQMNVRINIFEYSNIFLTLWSVTNLALSPDTSLYTSRGRPP